MADERELKKEYRSYIIPAIVSQVVFTAYVIVDGIFVARGVSETALAGINIAAPFVTLLWAVSLSFAAGTSTVAARLMGEGKTDRASEVFSRNMTAMAVLGGLIAIVVMLTLNPFCELLGATDATREYVRSYLGTIAPFSIFFIASYTLEILTATDGHPKVATITVSIGVVANIILDWLFIIVMHKGVFGAAIATAVSQVMVIIAYLAHFCGPKATIRFRRFEWSMKSVGECFAKGIPSGINEMAPGFITFIFVHAIQLYLGEKELVTYSAVNYIACLLIFVSVGIAQGGQPLLSYYNGSGERENIGRILKYQVKSSIRLEAIGVCIVVLLATPLIKIFISSDEALIYYSAYALKIFVASCLLSGINIVMSSYFTSLEKPLNGGIISLSRCTLMLVIGIAIAVRVLGPDGIWWGMAISELLTLAVSAILYKKRSFE